jgi:hypothetical protein
MRAKRPWLFGAGAATLCLIVLFNFIGRESTSHCRCQLGAPTLWHAELFGWLSEKFESRPKLSLCIFKASRSSP